MADSKIKLKHDKIVDIFKAMDYGSSPIAIDLAKNFFEKNLYSYGEDVSNPIGVPNEIKDVNTGDVLTTVFTLNDDQINQALDVPSKSGANWSQLEALTRMLVIHAFADKIKENVDLISQVELSVRGTLPKDTRKAVSLLIEYLHYYTCWVSKVPEFSSKAGSVVVVISNDTHLGMLGAVLAPSLYSGKTVFLLTELDLAPCVSVMADIACNAGIPSDVLRIIHGSVNVNSILLKCLGTVCILGINVYTQRLSNVQKIQKNHVVAIPNNKIPMVIFNDADLDSACECAVEAIWGHRGNTPWSVNTLIVQEDVFEEFVDKLKSHIKKLKVGNTNEKVVDISRHTFTRRIQSITDTIKKAEAMGIEVFTPKDDEYPVVFIGGKVCMNNVIIEDDDEAPTATVLAFRTAKEAVQLANNSRQGTGVSVWSEKIALVNDVVRNLKMGNIWINSHGKVRADVPWTTHKRNCFGYVGGSEGLYEYCNEIPQTIDVNPTLSLSDVISSAEKAQQNWCKFPYWCRFQVLVKLVKQISDKLQVTLQDKAFNNLKATILDSFSNLSNRDNHAVYGRYNLTTYREPVGVVAIVMSDVANTLKSIFGGLLLGNAIILLTNTHDDFTMISKFLPPKLLIPIKCNNDNISAIVSSAEVGTFISNAYYTNGTSLKPRMYINIDDWEFVLRSMTLVKNVWSNIGQAF